MEPSNKNFKYWFVNIFSVVISVLLQIILFRILLLFLLFNKVYIAGKWLTIYNLLPLLILFFVGFVGSASTILYSTNKDGIHILIAAIIACSLFIFVLGIAVWHLAAYPIGLYLGHLFFKKRKHYGSK